MPDRVQGETLQSEVSIPFEAAVGGKEIEVTIPRLEVCEPCAGTGGAGQQVVPCSFCEGTGQIRVGGAFAPPKPCQTCDGTGQGRPCPSCRGSGRVEVQRTLAIKIPPGVDTGLTLRLIGEGDQGCNGGANGDLHLRLTVLPHPQFRRDGFDVWDTLALTEQQLAAGTEVEILTVDGLVHVQIPAKTAPGNKIRLREKGIPKLSEEGRGDHYAEIVRAD